MPRWWAAVEAGLGTPEEQLPRARLLDPGEPPPQRSWKRSSPEAADRLAAIRTHVVAKAVDLGIGPEVLISPAAVRRIAWRPPAVPTREIIDDLLAQQSARDWQRELVVPLVVAGLTQGALKSESAGGSPEAVG